MAFSLDQRRHAFTFDEYLSIADKSATRLELWEGTILDMSGGSPRHSAICANLVRALGQSLRGKPCRVYDANLRVRSLAADRVTYADAAVVCGPLEIDPDDATKQTVLNPTVLFEVLSPSTERDHRGAKLDAYKAIPSVRAVVLVAQDRVEVALHERGADGAWSASSLTEGAVELTSTGSTLVLGELYEDLPPA
jgi:Uma2 family endonuclease